LIAYFAEWKSVQRPLNICLRLKAKRSILFTYDEEGSERIKGTNIDIISAWKWMLKEEQN